MRKLFLLIAGMLLLTGCWNRREINDLGPVLTLGLDRGENENIIAYFGVAQPSASPSGKGQQAAGRAPRVVLRREGRSIPEAIRKAELASPRRLALHHSQVILISETLAEHGLDGVLDFLARSPELRLAARVMVVKDVPMDDMMAIAPLMRTTVSEALRELEASHTDVTATLKDLLIARRSAHQAVLIPVVTTRAHAVREPGAQDWEMELSGSALFKGDHVATYLDEATTRGALWLKKRALGAIITIECPVQPTRSIAARVVSAKHTINTTRVNRGVSFAVRVESTLHVTDVQCPLDVANPLVINQLEQKFANALAERVLTTIKASQKTPADPFQFGEEVRVHYADLWKQVGGGRWHDVWANTPVLVSANASIRQLDMSTTPPILPDPE